MRKLYTIFSLLLISNFLFSQTLLDERALISFDKGLGFHSPDSCFGLNLRFRIQNRVALNTESEKDLSIETVDARTSRLRLRLDGYLLNQKLTYVLQLGFSKYDMEGTLDGSSNIVRDAIVYYNFTPDFYVGFGQSKLPSNRQEIISSGQQQFIDRSIVNAYYSLDRDYGLFGYYSRKLGQAKVNLKGAITTGEGRNTYTSDAGLCYTGRVEVLPFGNFTNNGDFSEGDLEHEKTPKLSVAGGYSFNKWAKRTKGQTGTTLHSKKDLSSVFADLLFKYWGIAFYSEYMQRIAPYSDRDEFGTNPLLIGYGFANQLSYTFLSMWEINTRYAFVRQEKNVKMSFPNSDAYTLGCAKYFKRHATKIQANFSLISKDVPSNEPWWEMSYNQTKNFVFQLQLEFGI
ncbi:MAG: OprO/OprP family phosphate-selective porin [Lentimicrobiaceae bacterium]|nr:OprO/OprP family phosphate-selective porin [Lentimicrobiaceae bacterium]